MEMLIDFIEKFISETNEITSFLSSYIIELDDLLYSSENHYWDHYEDLIDIIYQIPVTIKVLIEEDVLLVKDLKLEL